MFRARLNRKHKNFAAQFRKCSNLTVAALEIEPKSSQAERFRSDVRDEPNGKSALPRGATS
jgi:hypothetical protein